MNGRTMTLHGAIERVLLDVGHSMTTSEIAGQLNARGLYTKRDGSPVSVFQVYGRTRNHPHLFTQVGSTVSLARSTTTPQTRASEGVLGVAHSTSPIDGPGSVPV